MTGSTLMIRDHIGVKLNTSTVKHLYDFCCKLPKVEEVTLDFKDVTLGELYSDDNFKELLINPKFDHIRFLFHNENRKVKLMGCIISMARGKDFANSKVQNDSRVEEVKYDLDKLLASSSKSKPKEVELEKRGISVDPINKHVTLYYYKHNGNYVMSSISSQHDVIAIYNVMLRVMKENNIVHGTVDFGELQAFNKRSVGTCDVLVQAKRLLKQHGLEVEFLFRDEASKRHMDLAIGLEEQVSKEEALNKIKTYFPSGTVGMLAFYIPDASRKDRVGRWGNGEVYMREPAIFLGCEGNNLRFRVFRSSSFKRRADFYRDARIEAQIRADNGEEYSTIIGYALKSEEKLIPFDEVGIARLKYGSQYHFSRPVQTLPDESKEVYAYSKISKTMENVKILLPRWLQLVLDENLVEYSRQELSVDIGLSEVEMRSHGYKLVDETDYIFNRTN